MRNMQELRIAIIYHGVITHSVIMRSAQCDK